MIQPMPSPLFHPLHRDWRRFAAQATVVIAALWLKTLDRDEDVAWQAVMDLQNVATRPVFEQAARWCGAENPAMRKCGADVLGQLGIYTRPFLHESLPILADMLQRETEALPLRACICALGHLGNPAVIPLLAAFAGHTDDLIRLEVTFALGKFPNEAASIALLLQLMQDADGDVRDWATFGLGVQGDADSPIIRDALYQRLHDLDHDVREEAMVGLAKRQDWRVLDPLCSALHAPTISVRVIDAACFLLGIDDHSWDAVDYIAALQEKQASTPKTLTKTLPK